VALGDVDGKANVLWSLAQIQLAREAYQEAYEHLAESYRLNMQIGRLDRTFRTLAPIEI